MGQPPTVRPELAALLATVRANPEEDTPRLVLADWLDEQGNTRDTRLAALIRSQIAMPTRVEREAELSFANYSRRSSGQIRTLMVK